MTDVRGRIAKLGAGHVRRGILLTAEEAGSEPIKWLKYTVLDRVGVESLEKTRSQVQRFNIGRLLDAEVWASEFLSSRRGRSMVVAKVVPWEIGAQLQNFRMFSVEDVERQFALIADRGDAVQQELWCCGSNVEAAGFNLGGRVSFRLADNVVLGECIWGGSPRMVETVRLPGFELPYAKWQLDWRSGALIRTILHCPAGSSTTEAQLVVQLDAVVNLMEERRDALDEVVEIVGDLGVEEVSFCFKISDGLLTVIDWDTVVESTGR